MRVRITTDKNGRIIERPLPPLHFERVERIEQPELPRVDAESESESKPEPRLYTGQYL